MSVYRSAKLKYLVEFSNFTNSNFSHLALCEIHVTTLKFDPLLELIASQLQISLGSKHLRNGNLEEGIIVVASMDVKQSGDA